MAYVPSGGIKRATPVNCRCGIPKMNCEKHRL